VYILRVDRLLLHRLWSDQSPARPAARPVYGGVELQFISADLDACTWLRLAGILAAPTAEKTCAAKNKGLALDFYNDGSLSPDFSGFAESGF
jgi:hypothetical protein